jgi:hypothetical protein
MPYSVCHIYISNHGGGSFIFISINNLNSVEDRIEQVEATIACERRGSSERVAEGILLKF